MKRIFIAIVFGLLVSCAGKDGAVGPQGEKGDQGIQGEKGNAGEDGSKAYTYDFSLDVTEELPSYPFNVWIDPQEFVLVFVKRSDNIYSPLPYDGYAYATNGIFKKVKMSYDYATTLLFIHNETSLPAGTKFNFRAVVIKGVPGKRLSAEILSDYEKLKTAYNLLD